jgi:ribosomal subunit interface protein
MLAAQVTIRDMPSSLALDSLIRRHIEKLNRFYKRIMSCRVVVEHAQKHKHQGKLYNVRIDVTVPGKELVVNRKKDQDIYVTIRDAFKAIERQLEEHSRKRHGRVKSHNDLLHGHVARLVSQEGYGFIEGTDGNEYYFSLTNVSYPQFKQLNIGDAVEYVGETQGEGRQALHIIRERHNNHVAA